MESRLHGQPRHKLYMTECAENFSSSFNGEEQERINGFLATLPLSDEEVTSIEKETRGQSSTRAWKEHRKGALKQILWQNQEGISSLKPPHYLQNWCMAVEIWIMSHLSGGEKKMRTKHSVTSMQLLYPSTGIAS